ncbi:hypothetical protein C9I57_08290 [Trinickia symbiotica]|uniref:Peptidase C39 domain-containing protein n=1 Tax=Trinickia symbiotica TaxID=863227 RepID=A0A2T3XYM7_9BURK|nr:hypothetical protein [Trinickia symbiotica]PTB21617.1 hypothetical protein C9I57_08290 [Trinickia symbiotica]
MPSIPTTVRVTETGFEPAYRRVQQSGDFDCPFAVIAMIAHVTLDEVRRVAVERFHHPPHGPYCITGELAAKLLGHYGYSAGMYEEPSSTNDIPDLAIALVDYDDHTNLGRHVLFHRARCNRDELVTVAYVIDPAYWLAPQDYVRTSLPDIQWFLEVYPKGEYGHKVVALRLQGRAMT